MNRKTIIIFRVSDGNRLTLPVLFNLIEQWDQYFDLHLAGSFKDVEILISGHKRVIVAYSFMTSDLPWIVEELKILKQKDNVWLLAGGAHPVGDPEGTLRMGFHTVCAGEGETILPEICETWLNNPEKLHGRILKSDASVDLDESFPIANRIALISPLEITRGCFNHCRFCQTRNTRPRHRSLSSIQRYLDELIRRKYLLRTGFICPSGFEYGADSPGRTEPEKIEAVLRMAREADIRHIEFGIFPSEVRPNTVTPECLRLIKKYCANNKLTIGAQSGSDPILKRLRRGHTTEHIERATALTREHGLTPQLDFIFGFPGETEEEEMQTLDFIRRLGVKYRVRNQIHFFMPLSGTPFEDQMPAFLSPRIMQRLDKFYKAGVCTNWWKNGMADSRRIVEIRQALSQT